MASQTELAFAKDTLLACTGYNPDFLSKTTPIVFDRIISPTHKESMPEVEGNKRKHLHYTSLTVLYNADRRVPFVSAYNIDGSKKAKGIKRASSFKSDPRIDADIQLSKKGFYDLRKDITEFEIGHMAANNEMAWGNQAQLQSFQTFHFPNSVPQAERLNTGIWKSLETYIINEAATSRNNKHINVFTGPVLRSTDPTYVKDKKFKIPLLFYKVIIFMTSKGIFSTGFLMSHEQRMRELKMFTTRGAGLVEEVFDDFPFREVFQVNIDMIEELSGLRFSWKGVTRIGVPQQKNQLVQIRKIKDAADATRVKKDLRRGLIPTSAVVETVSSEASLKANSSLNMILP